MAGIGGNARFFPMERLERAALETPAYRVSGRICEMTGLVIESEGPRAAVGDLCEMEARGGRVIRAQVIGFRSGRTLLMPLEETDGIEAGGMVVARTGQARFPVGHGLLGRVIDGFGEPMDGRPLGVLDETRPLYAAPPGPLEREHIVEPLVTGVRAIDGLLTCGKGQRVGIFGGSGVGKSTLLGCLAKQNKADVSVVALIGERNREVRSFIEHELGPEGLARSVIVCATSDRPAPLRVRACFAALAVAEYFRDQGADVMLIMDSVTRLAMAQREIGLAAGEPPSQKGYTPSVFNLLPKIFERAGRFHKGSITGLFTVLVEGDDFNEPIADAVRGILDGHIILTRDLATMGHYPAIDLGQSVSRLASAVSTPEQKRAATRIRQAMAEYSRAEDLINLGAYASGANPQIDSAIQMRPKVLGFLRQTPEETTPMAETLRKMSEIAP